MRPATVLLLMLAASPGFASPVALGPCGPVARRRDALEVAADQLKLPQATLTARLGLVAFRDHRAAPIPFQVDQRSGDDLVLSDGPEATPRNRYRPGLLGSGDLLVFMACDAGEKAAPAALEALLARAAPVQAWREVRIDDPLGGPSGFVYVLAADHPPPTDASYVDYEPARDLVSTRSYRVGMEQALPRFMALGDGTGYGPNLLDGLRLRAEAESRAGFFHWKLNEEQGWHRLVAWKSGPVRVIRRSRHEMNVGLGLRVTAAVADTYFYPGYVFGPGSLRLPVAPGLLFRRITAYGGADFRDLRGWRYHAPGTPPEGFAIDGHMDATEQAFDATGEWFVLERDGEALLFLTRMSENLLRGIRVRLLYVDDDTRRDPPETVPGACPLAAYRGLGVEKLPRGRYTFQLSVLVLRGYRPGDEARAIAELDAPPTATVTAAGDAP